MDSDLCLAAGRAAFHAIWWTLANGSSLEQMSADKYGRMLPLYTASSQMIELISSIWCDAHVRDDGSYPNAAVISLEIIRELDGLDDPRANEIVGPERRPS